MKVRKGACKAPTQLVLHNIRTFGKDSSRVKLKPSNKKKKFRKSTRRKSKTKRKRRKKKKRK